MGVLKAVMNIQEVFSVIDNRSRSVRCRRASRAADGRRSHHSHRQHGDRAAGGRLVLSQRQWRLGTMCQKPRRYYEDPGHGEPNASGPLRYRKATATSAVSVGSCSTSGKPRQVFAPVNQLRRRIIWLSLLATIVAVSIGGLIALSLSQRVATLGGCDRRNRPRGTRHDGGDERQRRDHAPGRPFQPHERRTAAGQSGPGSGPG